MFFYAKALAACNGIKKKDKTLKLNVVTTVMHDSFRSSYSSGSISFSLLNYLPVA